MKKIIFSILVLFNILSFSEEGIILSENSNITTYQERKEERGRIFPLFSDQVKARGINLPLPFGVSILGNVTNVSSSGDGLSIDFGGNGPIDLPLKLEGDITAQITGVMLDFYPLSMLNIFGYAGYIRTSGELDIKLGGLPNIKTDFGDEGQAYGIGFNLAGGYENLFLAVNGSYTYSKMDATGALKETFIITPRIGLKNKENTFQIWTGIMYMNKDSDLTGSMPADSIGGLPEFDYILALKTPKYAPTIGFRYVPVKHFEVICDAFLTNDFNGVSLRLAYRY